jgi:hypothetical protein
LITGTPPDSPMVERAKAHPVLEKLREEDTALIFATLMVTSFASMQPSELITAQ